MEYGTELTSSFSKMSNSNNNKPIEDNYNYKDINSKQTLINSKDINIEIPNYTPPPNKTKQKIISINSDNLSNSLDNLPSNYYLYKKLGNSFSFFGNKYGDPLFIIGPNWRLYLCFSFSMSALYYFLLVNFWNYINLTPKILGIIIYLIFYLSYTYTFLINPGYPKHDIGPVSEESKEMLKYCKRCKIWVNKQKNTIHCDICGICIEEYDHHCIWTSKCIGEGNICSFNIFVIFTCIAIIYPMIILFLAKYSLLYLE